MYIYIHIYIYIYIHFPPAKRRGPPWDGTGCLETSWGEAC